MEYYPVTQSAHRKELSCECNQSKTYRSATQHQRHEISASEHKNEIFRAENSHRPGSRLPAAVDGGRGGAGESRSGGRRSRAEVGLRCFGDLRNPRTAREGVTCSSLSSPLDLCFWISDEVISVNRLNLAKTPIFRTYNFSLYLFLYFLLLAHLVG